MDILFHGILVKLIPFLCLKKWTPSLSSVPWQLENLQKMISAVPKDVESCGAFPFGPVVNNGVQCKSTAWNRFYGQLDACIYIYIHIVI